MTSVAVVIPCYNGAAFLPEALESVLAQTRQADEIIVIDDGSQDNTAEVGMRYPGVQVHRIANGGVSHARNTGAQMATSEWIAFLDHDDVWLPSKLQKQMDMLTASPGYDVCVCDYVERYQTVQGEWPTRPVKNRLPPSDQVPSALQHTLRFNPSATVIRRSTFLSAGGFDATLRFGEDWDLWLRLAHVTRFCAVREPMLLYRVHGGNTSRHAFRMMEAELQIWDRHIGTSMSLLRRTVARRAAHSRFLAGVALVQRDSAQPHTATMARSLAMWPFGASGRYKVFLHMLLHKAGVI